MDIAVTEELTVWAQIRAHDSEALWTFKDLLMKSGSSRSCLVKARDTPFLTKKTTAYVICYLSQLTTRTKIPCYEVTCIGHTGELYDILLHRESSLWVREENSVTWSYTPLETIARDSSITRYIPRTFGPNSLDIYPESVDFRLAEVTPYLYNGPLIRVDIPGFSNCIIQGNITL